MNSNGHFGAPLGDAGEKLPDMPLDARELTGDVDRTPVGGLVSEAVRASTREPSPTITSRRESSAAPSGGRSGSGEVSDFCALGSTRTTGSSGLAAMTSCGSRRPCGPDCVAASSAKILSSIRSELDESRLMRASRSRTWCSVAWVWLAQPGANIERAISKSELAGRMGIRSYARPPDRGKLLRLFNQLRRPLNSTPLDASGGPG